MFSHLKNKFRSNPSNFYALSIAATWAGVGSLLVGIETAQEEGIIPFLLWALGNTLACIVFGLLAPKIPKLRDVFHSRIMQIIIGLMCPFQIWIGMNGIQESFAATPLGAGFGTGLAYALAIAFLFLLFFFGIIHNIFTDDFGWVAVYIIAAVLCVGAIIYSHGDMVPLEWGVENIGAGIKKCLLLIPGPFIYPYFFELLDYNEDNPDGVKAINIRRSFTLGGVIFGAYLTFTFLLAWTNFSPILNVIKACLVTLVALSTITSMQYGIYGMFGKKLGFCINIAVILLWRLLVDIGVMGIWTLMANIRICIVLGAIAAALIWNAASKRKELRV